MKNSKLGSYYQISSTENKEVRFLQIGYEKNSKFTGIIYGYAGGGDYAENIIIEDEFIGEKDLIDFKILDKEIGVELTQKIKDEFDLAVEFSDESDYLEFNQDTWDYIMENNMETFGLLEDITPISYYNTTFNKEITFK